MANNSSFLGRLRHTPRWTRRRGSLVSCCGCCMPAVFTGINSIVGASKGHKTYSNCCTARQLGLVHRRQRSWPETFLGKRDSSEATGTSTRKVQSSDDSSVPSTHVSESLFHFDFKTDANRSSGFESQASIPLGLSKSTRHLTSWRTLSRFLHGVQAVENAHNGAVRPVACRHDAINSKCFRNFNIGSVSNPLLHRYPSA